MKTLNALILPALLILGVFACKKPASDTRELEFKSIPPVVFYTSLADSLPEQSFQQLQIGNVTGIKVRSLSGSEARYFAYNADAKTVLRTISKIPFKRDSVIADTNCRRIHFEVLQHIASDLSPREYSSSAFFWTASADEYDAYECVKGSETHIVLVNRFSSEIMHRISRQG